MLESLIHMRENLLKRRIKEKGKTADRRNIVIYDAEVFKGLVELAHRESTTVSAILNNLYEDMLFKLDSPQKTIDVFESEKKAPEITAPAPIWRAYLKTLNREEYREFDLCFRVVLRLANERFGEL